MFILSPVTKRALFSVLSKAGLFRRRYECKFIIERSEPESIWNLTFLLEILTVTYLSKYPSLLSPVFVLFYFWVSFIFWHTNMFHRGQLYHSFYRLASFSLEKTSSLGQDRYNMVPAVDFFVYSYFVCRTFLVAQFYFSLSVGNSVSVCSLFSFNMSNSRFLNSFRITFNGFYPLVILSQFFKGPTLFVL